MTRLFTASALALVLVSCQAASEAGGGSGQDTGRSGGDRLMAERFPGGAMLTWNRERTSGSVTINAKPLDGQAPQDRIKLEADETISSAYLLTGLDPGRWEISMSGSPPFGPTPLVIEFLPGEGFRSIRRDELGIDPDGFDLPVVVSLSPWDRDSGHPDPEQGQQELRDAVQAASQAAFAGTTLVGHDQIASVADMRQTLLDDDLDLVLGCDALAVLAVDLRLPLEGSPKNRVMAQLDVRLYDFVANPRPDLWNYRHLLFEDFVEVEGYAPGSPANGARLIAALGRAFRKMESDPWVQAYLDRVVGVDDPSDDRDVRRALNGLFGTQIKSSAFEGSTFEDTWHALEAGILFKRWSLAGVPVDTTDPEEVRAAAEAAAAAAAAEAAEAQSDAEGDGDAEPGESAPGDEDPGGEDPGGEEEGEPEGEGGGR